MKIQKKSLVRLFVLLWLFIIALSYFVYQRFAYSVGYSELGDVCRLYEEPCKTISFITSDGVRISSLVISPLSAQKNAVFVHGYGLHSAHFTSVFRAKSLLQQGYRVFLLDLRNHGMSQPAVTTAGKLERFDVVALMDFLKADGITPDLFWCVSMGCNAALYGLLDWERNHETWSLPQFIIESPMGAAYPSIGSFFWEKYFVPWIPVGWLAVKFLEMKSKISLSDLSPAEDISRLRHHRCVLLHAENDDFFDRKDAESIAQNASPHCLFLSIPDAVHGKVFEAISPTALADIVFWGETL